MVKHLLRCLKIDFIFFFLFFLEITAVTALCNFAHLFSSTVRSKTGFNEVYKPNRSQMQESFIPLFRTDEDTRHFITNINRLIEVKKDTEKLHPIGCIIGNFNDPSNLTFVLKVLHLEYRLKNIWQGMDLLFKLFILFKCDFPAAAYSVWTFFGQKYYGLTPPSEVLNKVSYHNARQAVEGKLKN